MGQQRKDEPAARAIAASLAVFQFEVERDPASAERLLALASGLRATDEARKLIEDLVPRHVDVGQWLHWLEGGPAPIDPFELREPGVSERKSASGRFQAARTKRDAARRDVERREAALVAAKAVFAEAEDELDRVDGELRASVAFSLLKQMNRYAAGAFSMGPAWSLMRIVSGYLQNDAAFEATLTAEQQRFVERDRHGRAVVSTELLDLLDRYSGDGELDFRLFRALVIAAREHDQRMTNISKDTSVPASSRAKRPRRRTEEQKASVHPHAIVSDRGEVLNAILATNSEEPSRLLHTD